MLRLSLIITLLFASPVRAGVFYTGNDMHEKCSGSDDFGRSLCMAYSTAVADVMETEAVAGWTACFSENVTVGQIRDIATRWLANHPQFRHYTAHSLIAQALSEAFPC